MALQFACVASSSLSASSNVKGKSKAKINNNSANKKAAPNMTAGTLVSVTNREQSLQLFHLLGKLLYNKRKLPLQSPLTLPT